jgi:hypothetical protein
MTWATRFKRLFVFSGILFLLISIAAFVFGKEKISEFEIVLLDHRFRGIAAITGFYCSLPLIVAFLAAGLASATWIADRFRSTGATGATNK